MIVLASKSASRRAMLDGANVPYRSVPADVDERAVEASLGKAPPANIARELAQAKAHAIKGEPGILVLGSDSLVMCGGQRFDKPESREQAAGHLRFFSGKILKLYSAAALVRNGETVWCDAAMASLHIRELSDDFVETYLAREWPAVAGCVGVFRIEALGVHLFERIDGDYFTILGMPLLPVLGALRKYGELPV